MLQRRIFSLNCNFNSNFVKYIEETNNLCVYKLGYTVLPNNLTFNNVDTLTIINCNKFGISSILKPHIFPNLNKINYISSNPEDYSIYKRFDKKVQWFFPDKQLDFYEYMIALGYGSKQKTLIPRYIINKQIIDGKNDFDISYKFDLQIPNYGRVDSEWYRKQFYEYIDYKYGKDIRLLSFQEVEELHLQQEICKKNNSHDIINDD